jgi:hypothetical protein
LLFSTVAVLSMTGTIRICNRKVGEGGGAIAALWHIIAARLPPAEEPPVACLLRSRERREAPMVCVHSTASQESLTAAGQGASGASLVEGVSACVGNI